MIKKDELQSLQCGHRARLRQKFLDGQLTEYEILELLLTYAIPRRDVRMLSRQLFKKYGSIHHLLSVSKESLMENNGIKENTATFLKLIHNIVTLEYKSSFGDQPIFYNNDKLINYCKLLLSDKSVEEFHVFYLDNKFALILDELHSSGTINWAAVYIREIVKKALDLNAYSVLLVHNHPSGTPMFSSQDIQMTQELKNALDGLGINFYDHLLIAGNTCYSARGMHFFDK